MKRSSAWLLTIVLSLLVCSCSRKRSTEARSSDPDQTQEAKPEEQEIKAATPEDPGPLATVIPLTNLKRHASTVPTKPEAELTRETLLVDHPVHLRSEEPRNLLHTVFSVNKYAQFAFVVPQGQRNTRLRGTFRSFSKRDDPDSTSDKTADVDLMLLNEQEFNEFRHGRMESATHELDPAHDQIVDWSVPPSYDQPQQYHLVFSNSDGGTGIRFVKADFTITFK
jgi:hypothetical protein